MKKTFGAYPEIIAVYIFGSLLKDGENAGDIDLAVLLDQPVKKQVDIYLQLYSRLAEIFKTLEPDILFLHAASPALRFEVISTGKVVYSRDDDRRTDFEYIVCGEYMDFKYHLDLAGKELLEVIREKTIKAHLR